MRKLTRKFLESIVDSCKKAMKGGQPTIEVPPEDLLDLVQNINVERFKNAKLNQKYSDLSRKHAVLLDEHTQVMNQILLEKYEFHKMENENQSKTE